jgi:hypothetical protein
LLLSFCGRFLGRQPKKMLADQFGVIEVERARVRLLLRDADLRQKVD